MCSYCVLVVYGSVSSYLCIVFGVVCTFLEFVSPKGLIPGSSTIFCL